jgi:hypothetical protein
VKPDSGTLLGTGGSCRKVIHDGVKSDVCTDTWTLTGKRGAFTTRGPVEWRDGGSPNSCGVAFGSWKVVRGTGEYAGITGGGRSAYDAHCSKWYARYEGFLTSR